MLFMLAMIVQDISEATLPVAAPPEAVAIAPTIVRIDTPVELMATKEVSTADVTAGTRFKLRLNKPVVVTEGLIIPVGTWAHGEVVSASDSGGLGKSGKMTARLLYLEFGANKIPLEGEISTKKFHGIAMVSAVFQQQL